MGGGSKTYKDIQVIPVMEDYNDLDKTLLLYDAQNISNGMGAVLEARKKTMITMRSTLNETVMERLGFLPSSSAVVERVDYDLLLDGLQDKYGETVSQVTNANIGLATIQEMGHLALQDLYSDYSVDSREFIYTDGYTYRYATTVEVGVGILEIQCYKKPAQSVIESELGSTYDTLSVEEYGEFPVETSAGVFEIEVTFNYVEHLVTISTDDNGTVTENVYTTTKLAGEVAGVVDQGNGIIVTTTINDTTIYGQLVYLPIEVIYISSTSASEDFMSAIISSYSTTHNSSVEVWYDYDDSNVFGLGTPPGSTIYSTEITGYSSDVTVNILSTSEIDVTVNSITLTNPYFDPLIPQIIDYERNRILNLINADFKSLYGSIVATYLKDDKKYIEIIVAADAGPYKVEEAVAVMPIIPLKSGSSFTDNKNKKFALKQMGMVGDEFNDSLKDSKVKYASLGFTFDVNDTSEVTTKLMYNTFEHLETLGYSISTKGDTVSDAASRGFTLELENMSIKVTASVTSEVVIGSIGSVGSYNSSISTYEEVYESDNEFTGSDELTRTKTTRIYRKQETSEYYKEISIRNLSIIHTYAGTSTSTFNSPEDEIVMRMPIIRDILLKLNFMDYIRTLQMSMVLFAYTEVVVETKWYQSGLFKFVVAVVAVVIAVYTGYYLDTSSFISVATFAGATAGAILAVANLIGMDLGVVGQILQVVAIIGAVVSIANIVYTNINTAAALSSSTNAGNAAAACFEQAGVATQAGNTTLAASYTAAGNNLANMANEFGMLTMGNVGGSFEAVMADLAGSPMKDITQGMQDIATKYGTSVPTVDMSFTNVVNSVSNMPISSSLSVVSKGVSKISELTNFIKSTRENRKLMDMQQQLMKLEEEIEKEEKRLEDAKTSLATINLMSPEETYSYNEDSVTTPDLIDQLTGNLEIRLGMM